MTTVPRRFSRIQEFPAHDATVNCVSIGRKSCSVVATGGDDKKVNLWTVGRDNCLLSLTGHTTAVDSVKFSHSDETLCAGSSSGAIKLWDLEAAKILRTLTGHRASVRCIDFHPYGDFIASGSGDSTIKLWDTRKRACIYTYKGHSGTVASLKFSPDGRWIASASDDGSIKLWDLPAGKMLSEFQEHSAAVNDIEFHPNEFLLASGSADRKVKFWDLETHQLVSSTNADAGIVRRLRFHPDGECLFSGADDLLKVYGWEPARTFDTLYMGWGRVSDLAFSDKKLIAASCSLTHVCVYVVDLNRVKPIGCDYAPPEDDDVIYKRPPPFQPGTHARRSFNKDKRRSLEVMEMTSVDENGSDAPSSYESGDVDIKDPAAYQQVFHANRERGAYGTLVRSSSTLMPSHHHRRTLNRTPPPPVDPNPPDLVKSSLEAAARRAPGYNHQSSIGNINGGALPNKPYTSFRDTRNLTSSDCLSAITNPRLNEMRSSSVEHNRSLCSSGSSSSSSSSSSVPPSSSSSPFSSSALHSPASFHSNVTVRSALSQGDLRNPITKELSKLQIGAGRLGGSSSTLLASRTSSSSFQGNGGGNGTGNGVSVQQSTSSLSTSSSGIGSLSSPSPASAPSTPIRAPLAATVTSSRSTNQLSAASTDNAACLAATSAATIGVTTHTVRTRDNRVAATVRTAGLDAPPLLSIVKPLPQEPRAKPYVEQPLIKPHHQQMTPSNDYVPAHHDSPAGIDMDDFLPASIQANVRLTGSYVPQVSEEETLRTIGGQEHIKFMTIMQHRLKNAQICLQQWSSKEPRHAIETAVRMGDLQVITDILTQITLRPQIWNLDMCRVLIPSVLDLLQSKYESQMVAGCEALKIILKNFGQLIKNTISSPRSIGVDVAQEERYNKCNDCYESLVPIRAFLLKRQTMQGKLGHMFRDVHVLMQTLD